MAQLLLVLVGAQSHGTALDLERLSVIEFLSANPFLALEEGSPAATELRLQGFGRHSIAYASPGQRFVSRRARVTSDVSQLIAFSLAGLTTHDGRRVFEVTDLGEEAAEQLCSVYADAYRLSVASVIPLVTRLSATKMREQLEMWLRADPVLFDLIDSPTVEELEFEFQRAGITPDDLLF